MQLLRAVGDRDADRCHCLRQSHSWSWFSGILPKARPAQSTLALTWHPFSLFPPQESFPAGSGPLLGSVLDPICLRDGRFLCKTKFITEPAGNQQERKTELFASAINYATGRMAAAAPMSRAYTEARGLLSQPWEALWDFVGSLPRFTYL